MNTFFITEERPNGTSDLIIVNEESDVIKVIENAIFGACSAQFRSGADSGVYAETCGGYKGQIHGAAYLNYDADGVMFCSNLDEYICECEECSEKGYEDSTCSYKDWDMIDYMDNCYDGDKLYWIDEDVIAEYLASSPTQDPKDVMNELQEFLDVA